MKKLLLIIVFLMSGICSQAQLLKQKEVYYETLFAKEIGGKTEIVLSDLARVDIVTDTFAIEIDFADKWAESIGQSLYYAEELNKKPGVLLLINGIAEDRYVKRLLKVAGEQNITVWLLNYNNNTWRRVKINHTYIY
jgi:hypothetical protein